MTQVTITLVGDPENVDRGIQGAPIEGDGIPYAQLPRTVLEVDEQTPLRVVLHNASALMGVDQSWTEHGPSWIAF